MKKPKANLYMLIKIEVDDNNFPNDDVIEVGWNRNKEDAIQKYIGDFCKKNNALEIKSYKETVESEIEKCMKKLKDLTIEEKVNVLTKITKLKSSHNIA